MRRAVWLTVGAALVLMASGCAAPLGRTYEPASAPAGGSGSDTPQTIETGQTLCAAGSRRGQTRFDRSTRFEAVRAEIDARQVSRRALPVQEVVEAAAARCEPCGEEEFTRHRAYVFLGYTTERGEGGTSIGASYEYRLDEKFGVAVFLDYVFGDVSAWAFGAILTLRPWNTVAFRESPLRGLTFLLGPGGDLDREFGEEGKLERELSFLFRAGVLYDIELGRGFSMAPVAYVDFIAEKKQAYIFGLEVGKEL